MRLIVDMNLSPVWLAVLQAGGHEALHWSTVGDPHAEDREITTWARQNSYTVFTHDLDFGALLSLTAAVKDQASFKFAPWTFDESRERVRLLPLK